MSACILWGYFVVELPHVVVAFQRPKVRVLSHLEQGHSGRSLLRYRILFVFAIHVLLSEVAPFILKYFAVQTKDLWEKADVQLSLEFCGVVTVYEGSLPDSMSMKV